MSKKKNKESSNLQSSPNIDIETFLKHEEDVKNKLKRKNRPIVVLTYIVVLVFLGLFSHMIYFMLHDSKKVISNANNKRQDYYTEYIIRGRIESSDGAVLAETQVDEEGNEKRYYPFGEVFSHVIGYNDYGRSGIELEYNFDLYTSNVDIISKLKQDFNKEKNPGDTVVTTLDSRLQKAAYDAFGNANGAAVVIEPSSGRILAMVSKPGFDPNAIDEIWEYIHTDEGRESTIMLNRATDGLYAPGSTFKIVTALEYIREHSDYQKYEYDCDNVSIFHGVEISCAGGRSHGTVDLADSIAYSCNTSFANIGTQLDKEKYRKTAEELLFNKELPYPGECKKSEFVINGDSDASAIPQTAIGQGDTLITPLHNAIIMSAIANGGRAKKPYMVTKIKNNGGATVKEYKSKGSVTLMTEREADILSDMLKGVCEYGTASGYFEYIDYTVAGKTGTAEFDNEGNCNSWFVGYSNVDNPDIVVSVIVEDYTSTQLSGSAVARDIFDAYYEYH
ncbi:peptidoglycan glycosyltransferase [Eubacterium ruminantium]|nr:peptidoglycan glycosyltransferase [Eubacterium ruminantium]